MRDPGWSTYEKRPGIQKSIHLQWILLHLSVSYFESKFLTSLEHLCNKILGLGQNWSNKPSGNLNLSLVLTLNSLDLSGVDLIRGGQCWNRLRCILITVSKFSETVGTWWSKDEMVVPANSALEKAWAESVNYWYAEYTIRCDKLILKLFYIKSNIRLNIKWFGVLVFSFMNIPLTLNKVMSHDWTIEIIWSQRWSLNIRIS